MFIFPVLFFPHWLGYTTDSAEPLSKLLGISFEEPQQRLKWQAHLEFTHNHDVGDLTWDKIEVTLPHSDKLRSLVLAGIPHSMRPQVRLLRKENLPIRISDYIQHFFNNFSSVMDETVGCSTEKEKFRNVLPRNCEKQLQ